MSKKAVWIIKSYFQTLNKVEKEKKKKPVRIFVVWSILRYIASSKINTKLFAYTKYGFSISVEKMETWIGRTVHEDKSNQVTSNHSLTKIKTHFKSWDSSFLHKILNFGLLARIFSASKLRVPRTFNTDVCSLDLIHYAGNSHLSCRDPTYEKNLFVWRLC